MDNLKQRQEACAEIEQLRAALKPFAEAAKDDKLKPLFAQDDFPIKLGLINGNVCQSVIEGKLHVEDFRRAAAAYQQLTQETKP